MQTQRLIVNDVSVDLSNDPIPYSVVINDIANLQSINGNFTKQFALPLTQRNRAIFGFPDQIQFTDRTPYQQLSAKYVVNGIEVIPDGKIEIQSVQNNVINVQLLAGTVDFADQLQYSLYDMGDSLSPATEYGVNKVFDKAYPDCFWDVTHAANSQKNTGGWIFSIIDYGNFVNVGEFDNTINVRGMRPCFFVHTAIELIVKGAGYEIDPTSVIYTDPAYFNLYPLLLIPATATTFEHGTDWQNANGGISYLYPLSIPVKIQHERTGNPNDGTGIVIFDSGVNSYTATSNQKFTAQFSFDLFFSGVRGTQYPAFINIYFLVSGDPLNPTPYISGQMRFYLDDKATSIPGSNNSNIYVQETFKGNLLSNDFEFVAGMSISVHYNFNHIGTDLGDTLGYIYAGAALQIVQDKSTVLYGEQIQCERILPQIGQLDFFKSILQMFGLTIFANPTTGLVTFTSFKEIVSNIPNALNWTDRCKDLGKEVVFEMQNLKQVNYLRYKDDTSIPRAKMPQYFADDSIIVNDDNLSPTQKTQDLFKLPYAPSRNRPYYGGEATEILLIDRSVSGGADTFSLSVEPRILIDQKINISAMGDNGQPLNIAFWDGIGNAGVFNPNDPNNVYINDVISVPYFYKPNSPDLSPAASHLRWNDVVVNNTTFKGLKSTYYGEYEDILNESKIVTRFFMLSPLDIITFDVRIPIYLRQDNAYFYVNKIDSWVANKPCKVQLIRL